MNTVIRSFMIGIVLMLLVPTLLQARIWTSSDGRYTVEAELVGYKDGIAKLKKTDGSIVSVRKEQLSQEDRDFLETGIASNEALTVKPATLPLGATMETLAISVRKKLPASEREDGRFMFFSGQSEGTVVSLLVQVPDYSIIALDEEASRLSKFVDDNNTDLLQVAPKTDETTRGMPVPMTVTRELIDEERISPVDEEMLSQALKPIFKDKEQEMIKTIFDEKYDAGVAEGFEKGEAVGIEKGEAKERNLWATDKIETLLQILTKRLGEVSPNVRNKLNSINDRAVLGELTDYALDCQTLDEFEAALNK